ncbi:NAC domain-containing protein 86 [Dorcoceras hygrometricum]|uniref:NAC domain-containing protein 86 n=1 Tax=Dorcoceras hygrometricum TaxID=472368 RepID=A0A2Z7ADH9_9LAMI|nr:NAC domain-containing protein 86 [Dorcoceras hygrometricum]
MDTQLNVLSKRRGFLGVRLPKRSTECIERRPSSPHKPATAAAQVRRRRRRHVPPEIRFRPILTRRIHPRRSFSILVQADWREIDSGCGPDWRYLPQSTVKCRFLYETGRSQAQVPSRNDSLEALMNTVLLHTPDHRASLKKLDSTRVNQRMTRRFIYECLNEDSSSCESFERWLQNAISSRMLETQKQQSDGKRMIAKMVLQFKTWLFIHFVLNGH